MVRPSRLWRMVAPSMSRTRRRHRLDDFIDWLNSMNVFVTNPSDPDFPNEEHEGDAQRSRVFVDFNMAQRPATPPAPEADAAIVVQTVYKTLTPTFLGPIAGYSTLFHDDGVPPSTSSRQALSSAQTTPFNSSPAASPGPTLASSPGASTSGTPSLSRTIESALGNTASSKPPMPVMTDRVALLRSASRPMAPVSTPDLSVSKKESASVDSGSSTSVKTGIAFGVLGGVIAAVLLAYLLFNRRRKQAAARIRLDDDDEKFHPRLAQTPSVQGNTKAPRLSLRPVGKLTPVGTAWDRPTGSRGSNTSNPFGIQSERPSTITEEQSMRSNSTNPSNSLKAARPPPTPYAHDTLKLNGRTVAAGAVLGIATDLSRKTSMRKDGPRNLDLTLPGRSRWAAPPSPAETEFSMSSVPAGSAPLVTRGAVAIEAAGGPANSGVHRVELDFKPTLDDEMDMCVGDLVRLLHEDDDGWCLVIRVNRSEQGVVPRTCLSSRPVKPRLAPGAHRVGPPVKFSGQIRGPGALSRSKPGASDSSHFGAVRGAGSASPNNPPSASSSRPQSPGGLRVVSPPQPGPSLPGPPPTGPPAGTSVGRRPLPGQNLESRSNWPREPRPWAA